MEFFPPRKILGLFHHEREVYKYDTAITHHRECMRGTCWCRTISWWSNCWLQWMNQGIPWNWFSPWTSMWESKVLLNFIPTEKLIHVLTFILCFLSCTSIWNAKSTYFLPPQQEYLPLLGHPLRHISDLRMYSFCQSPNLLFIKMYSGPYMAGTCMRWPVKCCLKSLLELFKWG